MPLSLSGLLILHFIGEGLRRNMESGKASPERSSEKSESPWNETANACFATCEQLKFQAQLGSRHRI